MAITAHKPHSRGHWGPCEALSAFLFLHKRDDGHEPGWSVSLNTDVPLQLWLHLSGCQEEIVY